MPIPDDIRHDVELLWDYHNMHHRLRPTDVGIGLGSHDVGVAHYTAELFAKRIFPLIVFSGANAPTTLARFPRGEALHYREEAVALGVPATRILVETQATNTGENITFTRDLLDKQGVVVSSVTLISRPYQQRRAYATCRRLWPEVEVVCASKDLSLTEYVEQIGDPKRVVDMIVGDTQRIETYAQRGFAIAQEVPEPIRIAYERLVAAGYTSRLI
jgi:uncharacterized SAM-binding protein YcdF (DUF218 family)